MQAAEGSSAAPISIPEAEPISPSRRSTRVRKPGPRSPILLVGELCTVHRGCVMFWVCTRACGMRPHAGIHAVLHVVLGLMVWANLILIYVTQSPIAWAHGQPGYAIAWPRCSQSS